MKPEGQAVSPAKVKPSVAPASFAAQATAQRRVQGDCLRLAVVI